MVRGSAEAQRSCRNSTYSEYAKENTKSFVFKAAMAVCRSSIVLAVKSKGYTRPPHILIVDTNDRYILA